MSVIISKNMALYTDQVLPLTHPQLCYQTWTRDDSSLVLTSSSETSGYQDDNVLTENTYEFWQPSSLPATLTFELSSAQEVNYVGIAAHTFGTNLCNIKFQYYNGSAWVDLLDTAPGDDSVLLSFFNSVTSNQFRINILSGTGNPFIGVVYFGKRLAVERRIYVGHAPITLSKKSVVRPNKSEDGNWLGRSVIRQGAETGIEFKNLSASWVREKFKPFMDSALSYPFFFAWRPTDYPKEVAYCWTMGDIRPQNSGPRDLMTVSFDVEAQLD